MKLDFHKLTVEDRQAVQAVSLKAGRRNCNFTFANLVGIEYKIDGSGYLSSQSIAVGETIKEGMVLEGKFSSKY